jgi:hypothetical protein
MAENGTKTALLMTFPAYLTTLFADLAPLILRNWPRHLAPSHAVPAKIRSKPW